MTNSEAISLLMNSQYYKQGYKQGVSDVLDKIRAEIKEEEKVEHIPEDVNMWHYIRALDRTLSIIDKYMAEGSEEE